MGSSQGHPLIALTAAVDAAHNVNYRRCIFVTGNSPVYQVTAPFSSVADYDLADLFENCLFVGPSNASVVNCLTSSAGNFRPGGVRMIGCSRVAGGNATVTSPLMTTPNNWSTDIPNIGLRCLDDCGPGTSWTAGGTTKMAIFEDGTITQQPNSNVLAGSLSKLDGSYATLLHFGQDLVLPTRLNPRRLGEPQSGSPVLGFCPFSDVQVKVPVTSADDATVGTITWTSPASAISFFEKAGEAYATAVSLPATTGISHYLLMTNFGFSIPTDATILGIRVESNKKQSGGTIAWNSVKLVKTGVISGTDRATDDAASWTTLDTQGVHGSSSQLWGLTWTPADINASTFGVAMSVKNTGGSIQTASIDGIRIVVYYRRDEAHAPTDITGLPRPAGSSSTNLACGCYERHNSAILSTVTYDVAPAGWEIDGKGDQELLIPVYSGIARTISIRCQFNSAYGGTTYPSATVVQNGEIGVAAQSVSATVAALNSWQTLTLSAITPSATGVLKLRLQSFDSSGGGKAFFDTVSG